MKKAVAALAVIFIFLVPIASGPTSEERFPYSERATSKGDDFLLSDWQDANSGNGDPLLGNLNGLRVASGTSVIDYTHSGYIGIDPPLGWSSRELEGQLDHLSMWADAGLVNPTLDGYHEEHWFITDHPEYNGDPFNVPNGWTIIKNDVPSVGTQHPQHGCFELNAYSGNGYDNTMGWRFDANYESTDTLNPSLEMYISQLISTPWRAIYSAEITFLYYVSSISVMDDDVYIFTRVENYTSKHHVFESGDPTETWVEATASIPSSFFQSREILDSLLFDIGLGTDINGQPGASDHEVYIDEVELRFLVRPFPEEIDLRANGAKVTGGTHGSVTPYVPDGVNRDCYSAPDSNGGSGGIDLDGYGNNGWLDIGADVPLYPDWSTAFTYQVGLQFPLHVPQGAAITSAHLQVEAVSDSTGYPGMRIYMANEDNIAAFASEPTLLPDKYDWVNTSVYWRPTTWSANGRYDTPEIAALIQDVVSRPGWQSGNYICLMIDYSYSDQQYAYNQIKGSSGFTQADLARLFVDFIEVAPADTIPSFRFNKNIVIDHTKVVSNLQDFPILVDIWDYDLHYNTQPDGDDIAFLYNNQVIPHELELFDKKGNGTHAHLVCWVKVPQLSSVEDTTIVMVYGDEDLGSQEDPEDVWNSDYSAVWHLNDNPAQPQWDSTYADYLPHQPQIQDSTLLGLDGLTYGTMTSSDSISGHIGNAIDLEGVNDFIDFGNPTELQMTEAFTVEAWFNADFIDNDYLVVKSAESGYRGWDISFDSDTSISPAGWVMFRFSTDGVNTETVGYERVDTGQWYHVVGVFNPSVSARFYLNGELVAEMTTGVPASVNDPSRPVRIGRRSDNLGGTSYLDAIVDEVRISNVAKSDAWIRTQYINQRNPELFITTGEESANFRFMKDITIDHNEVAADLKGFPVLIDIFDTDLHTNVQSDGDDIMFTSNGRSLSHEIELFDQQYNSTHAHLIAWIKADLSSTSDTVLTMYYSNPSIGRQENPTEVWRSDYAGVWHLGESGGDAIDSTFFGLSGAISGDVSQNQAGIAGSCYEFNGINGNVNFGDPSDGHLDFGENSFTYCLWVRIDQSTGNYQLPLFKGGTTTFDPGYEFETNTAGTDLKAEVADGTAQVISDSISVTFGQWIYLVAVVDVGTSLLRFYRNGALVGTSKDISSLGDTSNSESLQISPSSYPINGAVDEVRVISEARTAEWILTEYRNLNDLSSFYSVGIEQEVITPREVPLGFMYKKDISIDHNMVDSDLFGFPVLIDIYDTDLRTDVQEDGDDILFIKDGWILPHEIELFDQSYNSSHGHLIAWVRTDLSSVSDTVLSMYYGNPSSENYENPEGVWDTSFAAVWHLSEDPASTVYDSTANNNNGIGLPSGSEPTLQTGKIYECAEFYGETTNNRIEMPHSASLVLQTNIMVEAWIRTNNTDGSSDAIIAKWGDMGHRNYWLGKFDGSTLAFYVDNTQSVTTSLSWVNDGEWHHVVGVANAGTSELFLFVDGVERGNAPYSGSSQTGTSAIQIANNPGSVGFIQEWDGRIDEVRVSNSYRNSGWISTEFNNQYDPSSFYSISVEVFIPPTEFAYKKDIVIDHTKVEANLTGFPLLIDVFDSDLKTKTQQDGDDIIFKLGGGLLPHEIELFDTDYNSTHAHLVAWVKTSLSSNVDTYVTMYYGNSEATNQENPAGVWDDNYVGVWHLGEVAGGSNSIKDSTSQANHGTDFGSPSFGVSGAIGNAISFNDGPYIQIQDSISLDSITTGITISVWTRADYYEWELPVLTKGGEDSGAFSLFYYRATGTNDICYYLDGVSGGSQHTGEPVTRNGWMHVVLTYDGINLRVYKNGTLASTQLIPSTPSIISNNQPLYFGYESDYADYFRGIIDEARLSASAKPEGWILTEYNNQYNPSSFYSVGSEEQMSENGYIFTTSSGTSVTIGAELSLGVQTSTHSYADDFTLGTSFSIENSSLPIWTANVLISPPPELDTVSFEIDYPEGEWWPFSVKTPTGTEKTFATDWTCFDGKLIVGSQTIDEYGMWKIMFLDRNHVLDMQMGPSGGPYSQTGEFTLGEDIEYRVWSSGTIGSTISLELTDPTGSTWYSGSTTFQGLRFTLPYYHRKTLTINHENVAEDLVNFPVLVDIYDQDLRTDVRSDGRDIAFAINERILSHELELFDQTYNSTHAHLVAWLNVPLLSGSTDTVIRMYYGNPLAPIVYDSGPVWDSGYLGVWHLSESGTGALNEYLDSSQYKHHGQGGEGNSSFVPTQVDGKIGSGQDFNNLDGYYDLIDCGDSPLWNIDGYQITLEAWVQHDITPNTHVYGIMNHKGWYDGYSLFVNYGGGSTLKPTFSLPGETHQLRGANDVSGGAWHHIVATYDGSLMRIYVDGVQDPNILSKNDAIIPSVYEQGFWIGHGDQPKDKVWSAEWDGQIDEVRISEVVRSAGWIQTQFENQFNPSGFHSIGVEENIGYSESASINLDTSAPAGVWHATARYSDSSYDITHRAGIFDRSFIVKRGTSLNLIAPGDAISDGISTKLVGEQIYVEFELEDTLTTAMVSGATISLNWSVSGVPTDVQLNDYGDGRYGKTLNTSDLGSYGLWRLNLESSHPFYTNTTDFFYLDLSHRTFLIYEPPIDTPYGDNFEISLTLRDQFDNAPLVGATISCNGTILGIPVDYGNGTYHVTVDSTGLSTGEHTFRFTATPSTSYLFSSNIDVQFNYRPIATDATLLNADAVEAPWGQQANTSIYWYDVDHGGIGIEGSSFAISPFVLTQHVEDGGGYYNIAIDVSSLTPGTYFFNLTCSKLNYQSSTTTISIIILAHRTTTSVDYNSTIPVGTDVYLDVSWFDLDIGSSIVGSANLSQVSVDWGTGSDSSPAFGFWLDTNGWAIGVHTINVTIIATSSPRFYLDSYMIIQLEIRKLKVYLSWDPLEPFPNGNDFVMFIHVNISEPGSTMDGTPIAGLDQTYFSATNETGGFYTFESFTNLGNGLYQITIDSTRFLEGQYKIIVFVDFLLAENYTDTNTPQVSFTYRPILTYLSSPDYPTVTTSFDTNVTVTLSYVDIDHVQNITIGIITSEGASIVWQHIGNGVYDVLIIVQGWDLGTHEVNLTADASGYQAKTLTFQILVQIAYTYARSSVSVIDLPVGDTLVFFADYWDITHDGPILGATIDHNWSYPLSISWTGDQYRIQLPSIDTDALGSYLVIFNFSKGPNYQFGYFNISIILRTHLTEFRLASAIEPTSYNAMVNISVYCGDLDNDVGIIDAPVSLSIYGDSGWILSTFENDTILGNGHYIIRFAATNLGISGIYEITVYFNWTGPVQKYYDGSVSAFVRIVGEASDLELIDSAEPTPYLGNLSYTYLYSELYSGNGISNVSAPAGNVFIFVEFIGKSFSSSQFTITEDLGNLGYYTIEFNSTILDGPGVYTMIVYVNWSKSQEPFYGNWTDTLSVRIIPRSTLINLIPPESTPFGVNATFSFSFDDVAEGTNFRIAESSQMTVTIGLPDYSIFYNESTRLFHISFNTSVLGAPLGNRQFTIGVSWTGAPYYANVTGRTVIISVRFRETEFDYSTINPTPYGDNVTLHLTFTDITLGISQAIDNGLVTLYNSTQEIPVSEYSFTPLGNGEYDIELKTTYFAKPGTYTITVQMSTSHFYYAVVTTSRTLSLRYRLTVILVEPVAETPYNNSLEVVFHYSDLLTLADIDNSTTPTTIRILNGSSWLYTSVWRGASEDYLLTIQTYNQNLEINREYVLWIELSYPDSSPFYLSADTFVSFTLQERATNLELTASPEPTQYLEDINFTIYYQDSLSSNGISGATITLKVSGVDLVEGVDYVLQSPTEGIYDISLNTTALGPAGTTVNLEIGASWNSNAPYYSPSTLSLTLSVTQRTSITEILASTTQVKFLENVTFTISYSDETTGQAIQLSKDQLLIYSEGTLLQGNDFSMNYVGFSYEVSINSSVLNIGLVSNWNITFYIDWQNNVAPYYVDGRASAWVTVVNRIGIVIRETAPTVPIYDNMTFKITYVDDSTGGGINDAIVEFDCVSPSGLIEGDDFWIFRNDGNYSILVDTTSLGSTGTFTFSLRLLWNPTLAPFYRNTTTVFLQGTVRLIQAQLTNQEPDPSTVPINENVSVVLNLQDLDHAIPITGAESSFLVRYKTNASGPAVWSITPVSPGVYELVVDCSDAGAIGTNAFIISVSFPDYQTVEVQVPFQIRLRQGELNEVSSPSTFYGVSTYVVVELVDKDAGNEPISDATLIIIWPDVGYTPDYISLGNGSYIINLTTASLDAGLYTLIVGAQKSDYFISDISIPVQIKSIPTELILPQTISDVYWGEDVSIWAMFNDTQDNVLISGASLVYQFGVLSDSLIEVAPAGNYSFTVDTGNLAVATTYVVSISATLKNYVTVTSQITVNVLRLPIGLTVISESQPEVFKGTPVNITVYVNNTYSNIPLLGATVEVSWTALGSQIIFLSSVPGMDGYYTGFVDTSDLLVQEYVLTIKGYRTNYVTATTSVSVKINQIPTTVWLDALTETYSTQTFNWSETIRIGVYVLAPSLNLSYPLSTGLANCTVTWSLSGTVFTGDFLNGTSIGGPGYFYFDFETSDYRASTYTLRVTAYPNIGMFAYSSNLTTLIIEPIETSVESTYLSPQIWGWTGWVNLTYWDLLFDRGISGANIIVDWDGVESTFRFVGNGTYQIFINASLVSPGIYPVSVRFLMDNYKSGTGVFTLNVKEVPASISVFAPSINQIDGDVLDLKVPYGDVLPIVLFYNDTWYNMGIPGATEMTGVILGSTLQYTDYLLIEELAYGNYSLSLDTTRWEVSPIPYRVVLSFYLANWSRATINIQITIINVPTSLDGPTVSVMSYGQLYSIWVFYYDNWTGHSGEGIAGASINATSLDSRYVVVSLNQSDPSRPGWYEIRVLSQRIQGSAIVSIILSKDNYESSSLLIAISVEPSDFDILLERVMIYGIPIGLILLAGAVLWTRLFSVPKRLREIRGMVKTISKGKIPEPPDHVPSRQEIVADLFNDIARPIGITKTASSMPSEAIAMDVPEIEELLVQLSILSKLTSDELEDFKLDVSKMKLSEQVNFVKEVINQEAIKQGRIERKPMELILEETAAKARASLAGEEIEQVTAPEPFEERVEPEGVEELEEAVPEPLDFDEVDSTDTLSENELKEIRQRLMKAGIKGSELETIMDQTRELPRELAEELLKSILGKGGDEE